jgi:hypothetical protein
MVNFSDYPSVESPLRQKTLKKGFRSWRALFARAGTELSMED